ncbi:hypothetical protein EDB92DRAFT_1853127 [Lactarius akahatsu]|uniref:Uncharacterized protein n=1 Tax=Lactarius akahatsu TaxID=416441 RepID=A0AAD4LJV4_9AGAM|nr:hypothetical protein EDB92DRAFT_1853127 [Lactarius akahatsu]
MPETRSYQLAVFTMCFTVVASYFLLSAAARSVLGFSSRFEKVLTSRSGPEVRAKLSFRARWKSSGVSSSGGFLDTRKST